MYHAILIQVLQWFDKCLSLSWLELEELTGTVDASTFEILEKDSSTRKWRNASLNHPLRCRN